MTGQSIHLIYLGKLRVGCNLLPLGQAVEQANRDGMSFVLTIVGAGPERSVLEELALRTDGRVRVQSAVPHDEVPELLRQAHVGVAALPFPDEQVFGASSPIKLFEYMAAGLPIFSTRNVCYSEVVGAGAFAFWAEDASEEELAAALRLVWQARAGLPEMGAQAAAAAAAWSWHESARKLSEALEHGLLQPTAGSIP